MNDKIISYVAIGSLAVVMFVVICALLVGLCIDNKDIFSVLGPALTTIVACFITIFGDRFMNGNKTPPDP